MDDQKATAGTDVFIVDNSDDDWKVLSYLREWAQFSQSVDITTGYFEIGSLLDALTDLNYAVFQNQRRNVGLHLSLQTTSP